MNAKLFWNVGILLALSMTNLQAATYPAGIIAYWKFDEGTGTTVSDSINNYQGTILDGANWTNGVAGGALSFDGIDDYVLIDNFPNIFPSSIQNLTVELWLKVQGDSLVKPYNGFIGDGWGSWGNVNFNFAYDNINKRWDLWDSSLNCPATDMGYVYQDIGSDWTHVAITFGPGACNSGNCKSLYVNGELRQSNPVCPNAITYVVSHNLYIGASPGDSQYINASIDEVAIYNRALTAQEIQEHHQNGLNGLGYEEVSTNDLESLAPAKLWIGLKNSDDQGTQFDLRAEVYVNSVLVSNGISRCITGVTRNPAKAKEVAVPFGAITPSTLDTGDIVSFKVFTRIGTNSDDSKCPGHNNGVGVRLYYDATSRKSQLGAEISPNSLSDFFLHSNESGDYLDNIAPTATTAKFKDSSSMNFSGDNPWKEIGTWNMTIK